MAFPHRLARKIFRCFIINVLLTIFIVFAMIFLVDTFAP
ncbi:hypothetical protein G163CM_26120 [Pseudocitrobacter corydidari]|uniref:Uncharacterized protein n=1 Tax=Pseudocitrobacter corydidari TaxID=2891570 RepID=A0ABY3S607_9ENTR|nr:hypothetical protein G163CM_26120 [Pseudocitrobacter corydidari]